jgi:3-oxoacyl-[acyl-carrier protein] reductase
MLSGKTILVTGASRGIGAATARVIHREGGHVLIHYGSNRGAAARLAHELGDRRAHVVAGNLLDPVEVPQLWSDAVAVTGRIDALVNNAGAWTESPLGDSVAWTKGWKANIQLNLQAPADLCRLAIEHFQGLGGGIILNVASRSSHRGDDAEHLAYGAAKAGLLALTKGIARGFAGQNILAYAVAPGWVATDLAAGAIDEAAAAALPMGEPVSPQDVAEVLAFLASGRARHATGATVDITGADYVR